jgi:hypothetical protein
MPTALERAGDFSQSLDQNNALMIIRDPTNNAPFQGNRIPLTRIDSNGQALLNVFPQPNFTDRSISKGAYNYVTQFTGSDPLRLYTLKLDYNLTTNDSLSVTLTRNSDDNSTPNGGLGYGIPINKVNLSTPKSSVSTLASCDQQGRPERPPPNGRVWPALFTKARGAGGAAPSSAGPTAPSWA